MDVMKQCVAVYKAVNHIQTVYNARKHK